MTSPAEALVARIGHRFANPALLDQALTHRSAADPKRAMLDSNERLEFLGDRVLALLIAEWLAERFAEEREGDLGKRLAVLVSASTLAKVAGHLDLGPALKVPPSEGRTGLRARHTVLADATEALIGALYLDAGLEAARAFVRREWEALIAADLAPPMSAKSRLQETLAARGALAAYRLVSADGPAHAPHFVVEVAAEGHTARGEARTKQAAEQAAAAAWLKQAADA